MVIALGLAALMIAVSSTARTSGILRDKTIAGWIALNRLEEVRLSLTKYGQNNDTGELDFANRKWHYDTRYFNTNVNSMKRVVVRVYAGDAKTKGNPLIETVGFTGSQVSPPGTSNGTPWTQDNAPTATGAQAAGTPLPGAPSPTNPTNPTATPTTTSPTTTTGSSSTGTTTSVSNP